jgi:hypothetical protein
MNKLNLPDAIGCPWHGLCTDDIFTGGPTPGRVVSTNPAGATFRPAIPIIHPNAPGTGKLNEGNERAYATYVGHNRSVNGASGGTGLGWNRWLYCDPLTDATWLMRLEHSDGAGNTTIEVWCDGIFGRIGREYASTPRSLGTLTWVPEIPSWDTIGYTATNVMPALIWGAHFQLAISRDGSEVYLHIFTEPGTISRDLYYPTSQGGHYWTNVVDLAVVGIIKIALSGSSEALDGGTAITASITKDLNYEGGIVESFSDDAGIAHSEIFYKTSDGTCKRTYTYNDVDQAFTVEYDTWGVIWSDSGIAVSGTGSGTEYIIFAQNAMYLATYKEDVSSNKFTEKWVGQDLFGDAYTLGTYTSFSSYVNSSPNFHDMPYTRKFVGTFAPFSPVSTFIVGDATYGDLYTGTTYQYI